MTIDFNPYEGIDWASVVRVNAITHEHIFDRNKLQKAYNRGIRWFACINYQPAVPSYPLSSWNRTYPDYTSTEDSTLTDYVYSGSIPTILDGNGNDIQTDTLPQVPNAEHPCFANFAGNHFNVLGSTFPDAGWGKFGGPSFRLSHPLYSLLNVANLFGNQEYQPFKKVFGTINHLSLFSEASKAIELGKGIFKAMEVFNNGYNDATNETFMRNYDNLLLAGFRIYPVSVVDWQDYVPEGETDWEDKGCNVLLVPSSYDTLPANDFQASGVYSKAEAGLDAYIDGRYYCSGFGRHSITNFDAEGGNISISFDSAPQSIFVVVDGVRKQLTTGSVVSFNVPDGSSYARFEARWADKDFIYTVPVFYKKEDNTTKKWFILQH